MIHHKAKDFLDHFLAAHFFLWICGLVMWFLHHSMSFPWLWSFLGFVLASYSNEKSEARILEASTDASSSSNPSEVLKLLSFLYKLFLADVFHRQPIIHSLSVPWLCCIIFRSKWRRGHAWSKSMWRFFFPLLLIYMKVGSLMWWVLALECVAWDAQNLAEKWKGSCWKVKRMNTLYFLHITKM